jgi:hypothetical protein
LASRISGVSGISKKVTVKKRDRVRIEVSGVIVGVT